MSFSRAGLWLAALTLGISAAFFALAQQSPTFKVGVDVVNVLATVRDRSGRIVSDLTQEDFILEEDGKKQEIRYFSRQSDLPLTVGLLVDTSMSQRNLLEDERSASYQFLDQVLRADKDQAFVIKFDTEAELLQDITKSHSLLQKAVDALKTPSMLRRPPAKQPARSDWMGLPLAQIWPPGGGSRMPGGRRRQGGGLPGGSRPRMAGIGTVLYDAVFLASDEILQKQEGRKAIILISDGVDNGSKYGEKDATAAAHRADTLIYGIRYFDSNAYGGVMGQAEGSRGKGTLKAMSQETGGVMFEVTKKLTLRDIYDKIEEELRNQYNLGYTPSEAGGDSFRHITLKTKDGKLAVTTRTGYYPKRL